jgi:hypothetical protein
MLTLPATASAAEWETGIAGSWSVASVELPASTAYTSDKQDLRFIDFGGRLAHRLGPGFIGLHFGLYSSFGLREQVTAANAYAADFISAKTAETGLPVNCESGTHRIALGWNAPQLRYRIYWTEFFFAEAGLEASCEFGWLWARIREPNIFAQGEFTGLRGRSRKL